MLMLDFNQLAVSIAFSAGSVYGAYRVTIRLIQKDMDRRFDEMELKFDDIAKRHAQYHAEHYEREGSLETQVATNTQRIIDHRDNALCQFAELKEGQQIMQQDIKDILRAVRK